jgi:hypothetical protein
MVPVHQKRRRPRDLEDAQFDMQEDETVEDRSFSRTKQLDEAEDPIEVDENTRAAVRMSLYGSQTPEASQGAREGIRELSPNVTPWRKGMRQPRKKRRPSYWDGDLQHVRAGPGREEQVRSIHPGAERQVMTSPAKEDVESMRVSVREEGNIEIEYAENMKPGVDEIGQNDAEEEQPPTVGDEMEIGA